MLADGWMEGWLGLNGILSMQVAAISCLRESLLVRPINVSERSVESEAVRCRECLEWFSEQIAKD